MKKIGAILFVSLLFTSCKNDSKSPEAKDNTQEEASIRVVSGRFTYYPDAAVFQTKSELFGLVENEKAQELIQRTESLKDAPTDEVAVTLKVKVVKKPELEEGWENRIEIIDIINVSKVNQDDSGLIKLGS